MIGRRGRASAMSMIALLLFAPPAAGDPRLRLTREPPPRHLRMRTRSLAAVQPSTTARPPGPSPTPSTPATVTTSVGSRPSEPAGAALRDLRAPVSFSLDLGYQVDAASPTARPTLGGRVPVPDRDYVALRSYAFGEAFGSTRGMGLASLSTYFAARFQAARRIQYDVSPIQTVDVAAPIATWFERSGVEVRQGWAEMRDFLPRRYGLAKFRIRAGSQYVYGPWILHVDGVIASYDGEILTASAYAGYRHADYTRAQPDKRPRVEGASLRVDLRGLPTSIPIAVQAEVLRVGDSDEARQPESTSALFQGDWRPGRDIAMIGQVRFLDGRSASQRLEVRARYRQVTNVVVNVMRRTEDDWRWDPALIVDQEPATARRYLDLGPVIPQLIASARAGTLIAENVDLLVRAAASIDRTDDMDPISAHAAPYVELGGAIEVRLRRAFAFGASALTRQTERRTIDARDDSAGVTESLPIADATGENGFTEVGASLKMSLGARRFSSSVEVYGRRTRLPSLYTDPTMEIPDDELRLGGRVTVDAWVGRRVRLFASYDASSTLELAPEITGYRSLRLMMSGVY